MAWGNGAPDIFSSMAAVKSGDYQVALGGQLGTTRSLIVCTADPTLACVGPAARERPREKHCLML